MLADSFSSGHAWTLLAILAGACTFALLAGLGYRQRAFPIVNQYSGDFLGRKAHGEYLTDTKSLITQGLAQHKGPITIAIPHRQKIILPSSLAGWVKSHKDLDHKALVQDDFFSGFPGFEAQTVLQAPGETIMNVIRAKLGQNDSVMPAMNASLANALRTLWGDDPNWHAIDWYKDTMGIIARAASSVFVGPEKADDPEWLDLVQGYVLAYFTAVGELHKYPIWMRPIVHWFLPGSITCRKYVARARVLMNQVLSNRREEIEKAERNGSERPEYNDALEWLQVASGGKMEAGDAQLCLAMAAMFTTTEVFRQILIDVATHPEILEPLRDEISQSISTHGVSVAAGYSMVLLDSVMKESQRRSAALVALERKALKETELPNGKVIPRGAHIMVDSTDLWNPEVYPSPDQFDPHRFLRKREAGDKTSQFVQSGQDFNVFGGGRHICPGRFFAGNELKLALAHVLLKYDLRMPEGRESRPLQVGFYCMTDPGAQMEVRRREGAIPEAL